jgi:hypothetical protein
MIDKAFTKYCETKNPVHLFGVEGGTRDLIIENARKAIKLYKEPKNVYYYRGINAVDMLDDIEHFNFPCVDYNPLEWVSNSCYVDSVFVAFFAIPCDFTKDNILEVKLVAEPYGKVRYVCTKSNVSSESSNTEDLKNRKKVQVEISKIAYSLRGQGEFVKNCLQLRKALVVCPHSENFHAGGQQDAGEYFAYILSMFPNTQKTKSEMKTFAKLNGLWNETNSVINWGGSIIWNVYADYLKEFDDFTLTRELLTLSETTRNIRKVNTMLDSPYIIIHVHRIDPVTQKYINKQIIPTQHITLDTGKRFVLTAIVTWDNYHYTAYFRCKENWFHYDDSLKQQIRKIGSYSQLLLTDDKDKPPVYSNGIIYFYSLPNY